jgi:hypothetical protein
MALSRPSLIRMRSQVQVLAGPPPIVAGQSAAGTEPGALAGGLGRAGAARRYPPARPMGPPGPPTRASGLATTTHRGRAPSPRTAARWRLQPPCAAACSRAAQPPRRAPRAGLACLVAQRASVAAAARTNPAARVRHRPPSDQRDVGSVARVPASSTVDRAVDGPAATGPPPVPVVTVARPPPEVGGIRTRPDGRGRQQTAGHWTGGQQTATAGPAGRRPQVTGHRTAGQPDPGRRNRMGGHRMLDTGDRRRGLPAGRVDDGDDARPLDTGWTLLGADAVWASNNQDRSAARTPRASMLLRTGLATTATVSCRWYAPVELAPRRTAVLR